MAICALILASPSPADLLPAPSWVGDESDDTSTRASALGDPGFYYPETFCESFIDTEHFRIHYTIRPGYLQFDQRPLHIALEETSQELALVCFGPAGIQLVDVTDPPNPVGLGSATFSQPTTQSVARGNIAYVGTNGSGVHIVDMETPSQPRDVSQILDGESVPLLGTISLPDREVPLLLAARRTTQGAETVFFSLDDALQPSEISRIALPAEPLGFATLGHRIHLACAEAGVIVLDMEDPATPRLEQQVTLARPARTIALQDSIGILVGHGATEPSVLSLDHDTYLDLIDHTWFGDDPRCEWIYPIDGGFFWLGPGVVGHFTSGWPSGFLFSEAANYPGTPTSAIVLDEYALVADRENKIRAVYWKSEEPQVFRHQLPDWPSKDFLLGVQQAAEFSYGVFADEFALRPPDPDGSIGGGRDLLDLYLFDMNRGGVSGTAFYTAFVQNECGWTRRCFLGIDIQLAPIVPKAKGVIAHELFHAFQLSASFGLPYFFSESSAVWAERAVYPDVARSIEIRDWFATPHLPVWWRYSRRVYGAAHFWDFLSSKLGSPVPPAIMVGACNDMDWFEVLVGLVKDSGEDLDDLVVEFARWNYLTGPRHDGLHWPESNLPEIQFQGEFRAEELPIAYTPPADRVADPAGSNYYHLVGPGTRRNLTIDIAGAPQIDHRVVSIVTTRRGVHTEEEFTPDESGLCRVQVDDWDAVEELGIIVTHTTKAEDIPEGDLEYTLSISDSGTLAPAQVTRYGPSPFRDQIRFDFRAGPDTHSATLEIYDVLGRRTHKVDTGKLAPGNHSLTWDGTDQFGRKAASGSYSYRLRLGTTVEQGRIVLVH